MKIRLVSDLHIDVNREYGVSLGDDGAFTLIAGDICGNPKDTVEWVRNNVKKGAFCAGNHIVYNRLGLTIESIKGMLHEEFPLDSDITFFDFDVGVMQKEICDGVLLVSDVLYTDYRLPIPGVNEKGVQKVNMHLAEPHAGARSYLNDFAYGLTERKMYEKEKWDDGKSPYGTPKGVWRLRTKYYLDHHRKAWREIEKIVESNPDKDIILMTHHCISKRCISKDYVNNELNASYVSDKEDWILKHPNIRLVLSGHVHHRNSFSVGSTLYVLNPLGYCRDTMTQFDEKTGKKVMWTPDLFIDTDTWKLESVPYSNAKWKMKLKEYERSMDRLCLFF